MKNRQNKKTHCFFVLSVLDNYEKILFMFLLLKFRKLKVNNNKLTVLEDLSEIFLL